jgi:hypothetical protein
MFTMLNSQAARAGVVDQAVDIHRPYSDQLALGRLPDEIETFMLSQNHPKNYQIK